MELFTPELVALMGAVITIVVRALANHRAKLLEAELDDARERELTLERQLHTARCQLARLGQASTCPMENADHDSEQEESSARSR